MRRDAADAAFRVGCFVRDLADDLGPPQVATVGRITLHPNLVNVVAARATMTVDLRNSDDAVLRDAEVRLFRFLSELAEVHDVLVEHRSLARFDPVEFHDDVVALVERVAREHGHTVRRLPSGAGHDAQMLARMCPSGMVFVPSWRGISHNPAEHTNDADLEAGANVLLQCLLELAGTKEAR
jgi:N-carbamoyl-L-amino-acid hydrolase